jgi:hypothetical protein
LRAPGTQLADGGAVAAAARSIAAQGRETERMRLTLLSCMLLVCCADPRGPNWLECSLITTDASSKEIDKHEEIYVVNFANQALYTYAPDSREVIGPMKNVSFWSPDLINQDIEVSASNFISNKVLRINLKTMEIVDRLDTIGTGYNSGSSTHNVMSGTCKWVNPRQVG